MSHDLPVIQTLDTVGNLTTFEGAWFNIVSIPTSVSGKAKWGEVLTKILGNFSR